MPSRGQTITVTFVAWDNTNNVGKTGDAANFTLRWVKDGTSAVPTNVPATEVDATNAPGLYKIVLTGTECTCDFGCLGGKSSTSGVSIIPTSVAFEQLPTAAPNASGGLLITTVWTGTRAAALDNLDVAVSTRLATAGYTVAPSAATVAGLVWDIVVASHATAGSTGAALASASSAGDPWSTTLPGSYVAGTAGYIVGNQLDAAVSTRSTLAFGTLLSTPRSLDGIADSALTVNDAFWCAIGGAAGKESISGTTYTVKTPSTGTVLRTFTLDSATAPASRT